MAHPLTDWLRSELAEIAWLELDVIDLAEVELPSEQVMPGGGTPSPVAHRPAAADGFLVLTPEYNHSFPASLKNAIDWPFIEWACIPALLNPWPASGLPRWSPAHARGEITAGSCSPASTANGSALAAGGSGQVAKSV